MDEEKNIMMQKIVSLCKRRGFVFPSSEIYGGMSAIYDYGHYGALLKNNIRDSWWKMMIQHRDDIVAIDSAIFMHPTTWVASGHVEGFNDPQVDCKKCKSRFRADHMLKNFGIDVDGVSIETINKHIEKLKNKGVIKCLNCGSVDLTRAKMFNLMVGSNMGSPTDEINKKNVVYLRPETCGGIYLEYKNMIDSLRIKFPFGIAQVGKAFRNEIVARQFIFRTREFEQMEMQYFLHPKMMKEKYEMWKQIRWEWYLHNGVSANKLKWHKHEKLAHYASDAYDIMYNFKCLGGFEEVEGIHTRGNWDLSQHSKYSGIDLRYFDEKTKEKFIPHIMETSVGLNRLVLMFIDFAYNEEDISGQSRIVLKLPKQLAPIKIAVFPLLQNKPELVSVARVIYEDLKQEYMCEFDSSGNIGKRYRRQDEIGTPYCVTVDFDTLKDNAVTVRDRDTILQKRIGLSRLKDFFRLKLRF